MTDRIYCQMTDWVTRAANAHIERKISAVIAAVDVLGKDACLEKVIAAALREAVNQCQSCTGAIYSPDLIFLARKLEELSE